MVAEDILGLLQREVMQAVGRTLAEYPAYSRCTFGVDIHVQLLPLLEWLDVKIALKPEDFEECGEAQNAS